MDGWSTGRPRGERSLSPPTSLLFCRPPTFTKAFKNNNTSPPPSWASAPPV